MAKKWDAAFYAGQYNHCQPFGVPRKEGTDDMGSKRTSLKTVIITTLISSAATILVALIGIVPAFYERKAQIAVPKKTCKISGTITSGEANPLRNAEVYLIRATGSEFMTTTDDKGNFAFQKLPNAAYWVIVRDNVSEKASRILIENQETSGEVQVVKSLLKYKRCIE